MPGMAMAFLSTKRGWRGVLEMRGTASEARGQSGGGTCGERW